MKNRVWPKPPKPIDREGMMEACSALGIKGNQVFAVGEAEVVSVIERHIRTVDAVILGKQSAVFSHAAAALNAAGGKPAFSYAESTCL